MASAERNVLATGFSKKVNYGSQPGLPHCDPVYGSYKRARPNSNFLCQFHNRV